MTKIDNFFRPVPKTDNFLWPAGISETRYPIRIVPSSDISIYIYIYAYFMHDNSTSRVGGSPTGKSFRVVPCRAVRACVRACVRCLV